MGEGKGDYGKLCVRLGWERGRSKVSGRDGIQLRLSTCLCSVFCLFGPDHCNFTPAAVHNAFLFLASSLFLSVLQRYTLSLDTQEKTFTFMRQVSPPYHSASGKAFTVFSFSQASHFLHFALSLFLSLFLSSGAQSTP